MDRGRGDMRCRLPSSSQTANLSKPSWDSERPARPFRSTYYDDRMRASPALLRARAPYLLKNTITGFAICTLVIGVYSYTINAISQDEFDDVIVPDEPIRRPQQLSGGDAPGATTQAVQGALAARK
ncbi:hypothetical protein ACEQ8H_000746 [Pleosporales sp. CAS-2024a]